MIGFETITIPLYPYLYKLKDLNILVHLCRERSKIWPVKFLEKKEPKYNLLMLK